MRATSGRNWKLVSLVLKPILTVFRLDTYLFKMLLALSLMNVILSCQREEIKMVCADPMGSDPEVIEHLRYREIFVEDKIYQVGYDFICFQIGANDCFGFQLNQEQPVIQAFYIPTSGHTYASITDVGQKSCLAEADERPSTGWQYSTPIYLHHGYVVKKSNGTYARFFIDSWETGPDGFISKINILRQYSF